MCHVQKTRLLTAAALSLPLLGVFAGSSLADTVATHTGRHLHAARHHARAARRSAALAPVPAQKPAPSTIARETAAPTPNESVTPPPDQSGQSTSVAPAVMQLHYPPMGDGYTTGSSAQAMDDREAAKVTGVQLKVPLGQ